MERAGGAVGRSGGFGSQSEAGFRVSSSILHRVASGEDGALKDCMEQYSGLVWSLARRMLYDRAEAEDAVQDIFVDVWKNAERFDESIASEQTFVATIARRRLIDRLRKRGRRPASEPLHEATKSTDDVTGEQTWISEEARIASKAMETLSEEQQRCLRLSIFQGLTHESISESTGLPLGTVKTHIRRGLIRVREALASHESAGAEGASS